jgi:predicted transposase/invertase (TIGR01784 family)
MKQEKDITMASEVLLTFSKDEVERARLMSEYKYVVDTQSKVVHARRIGIQEGIQQGIQQGMQQGAYDAAIKTAKAAKKEGVNADLIVRLTGLSLDVIANL